VQVGVQAPARAQVPIEVLNQHEAVVTHHGTGEPRFAGTVARRPTRVTSGAGKAYDPRGDPAQDGDRPSGQRQHPPRPKQSGYLSHQRSRPFIKAKPRIQGTVSVNQVGPKGRNLAFFDLGNPGVRLGSLPELRAQVQVFNDRVLAISLQKFKGQLHVGAERIELR